MRLAKLILLIAIVFACSDYTTAQETTDGIAESQSDTTCLLPDEEVFPYPLVQHKPFFEKDDNLNTFLKWIYTNIRIPLEYAEASLQGLGAIELIINRNGDVCDVKVIRSIDKSFDMEVVRVIKEAPRWTPAVHNSQNVSVKLTIPIRIRL